MASPAPASAPWVPRYWIPGYDAFSLAAPVLLVIVGILLAILPAPKVPYVRRVTPPPPLAPTLILQPQAGAVLPPLKPFELIGSAQPGGTVRLYYGVQILAQTTAAMDGAYRFNLAQFPAGAHTVRVETVFRGRSQWSTELALRFDVPHPPAAKTPVKSGKVPVKKKPVLKH